ncbi:hypothetical protein ACFPOG_12825 [Paenibacillus aestuarii]|uniref:Uncharacterized protein n=1 Tax=Paenibacillus aestuarii TaxID=516965 RepID=A0ABW0K7D7_9BACL
MFVFQIVDEGNIKRVIAREKLENLKGLLSNEIKNYLDESGFEGTTEDGYAAIFKVDLYGEEEDEHLWSYPFDGDESVEDAILRIMVPVCEDHKNNNAREVDVWYRVDGLVTLKARDRDEIEKLFWKSDDGKRIRILDGRTNTDLTIQER